MTLSRSTQVLNIYTLKAKHPISKQLRLAGEYESLTSIIKFVYNQKTKVNSLHTLDSKFIKMANLVDCLARSSSFCSTAKNTMNSISITDH